MTKTTAIILAAGQGTRMKSPLPKVLHPVAGQPMILRILSNCLFAEFDEARVVLGHGSQLVKTLIEPFAACVEKQIKIHLHQQKSQLGTADAVKSADIETLEGDVVILNGDHPLITIADLKNFISDFREQKLDVAVVSVELKDPKQFGRIVRQNGNLKTIVEFKDASAETLKIKEVSTGIYVVKADVLKKYLPKIKNDNANKEYYLPDLISLALEGGKSVQALFSSNTHVAHGVNTQEELAEATALIYKAKNKQLLTNGVILIDPKTTYIDDMVTIGAGSVIYPGVFIRGKTAIGPFCVLEPNVFISDCIIEDGVQVKAGSYLEHSVIKSLAKVGPYARLRPDTTIGKNAHVGNFVEMKKVNFGANSKAGHLTYLGDADIGEDVNIGCGTITCNYAADKKKYKTKIGDRVFVGSDSQFIAPVEIGSDAIIASGSTITKNVPSGDLAIARARQENKAGLANKFKKKES
ncbi:MAG: bifunctional UDP-N-acetylglucosamine diphosphorylase/glucosamine-1-phosphate N-acetyltransferase GlmU [Bdellovibrionaceae bacterium]|nr:bifunctional UDP-N-acetylglucosamine diphosphorylase/glucosamine-1-phosphate N-acetyltransferase GlmU [Pseudobdellovibrionaceae bacterium]